MKAWLFLSALLFALAGCDAARENSRIGKLPLTATPARVDLGSVRPLSRHEVAAKIANPTQAAIARLDSSCECLSLELPRRRWEPGETVSAKLIVDLAKDPDFKGNARLTVSALDVGGKELFRITCDVSVQPLVPARHEELSRTLPMPKGD